MSLMGFFAGQRADPAPPAAALLARMPVQPDATRRSLINTTYQALLDWGMLAKLDLLYLMAAHDEQATRLNWAQPAYDLVVSGTGTIVFVADRYRQNNDGSNVAIRRLTSGFDPSTAAGKFSLNSASIGGWVLNDVSPGLYASIFGQDPRTDSNVSFVKPPSTSGGAAGCCINDNTSLNFTPAGGLTGLWVASRTAANAKALYQNGASVATAVTASTSMPAQTFVTCSSGNTPYQGQIAMAFAGRGLAAQEVADLYTITRNYLVAVGATS